MVRCVRRTMQGDVILTIGVERGDSLDRVREEVGAVNKHYTKFGYAMLTTERLVMNNMPWFVFKFDNETLAMKAGEDGVYVVVEYKDMDGFVEL